jgi:hypothetical protein
MAASHGRTNKLWPDKFWSNWARYAALAVFTWMTCMDTVEIKKREAEKSPPLEAYGYFV